MPAPFGLPAELDELLDDYEVVGELGRGGSAVVYRARDRALGRAVAVKVVHPRAASRDDPVARLAREARTVAQLEHPNIVPVYAVRRLRGGGLALIMPLVNGGTLKTAVQAQGPLAPDRVERMVRDVASALAYAHAGGLVHRDVKPENIFLDERSGRALLADFGIARSAAADGMTMTGTAVGTPFYMSPEQVDGSVLDGRSDLYSLGLAAWEALTGRRPWDGESLYSVIYKQRHEALPPIEALRAGVPRRLQYVVERMLQKRPGARWAGADALLAQLAHSVLPADYDRWQRALPGRVERYRVAEAERAVAVADAEPVTSASTLHFVPGRDAAPPSDGGLLPAAASENAARRPWVPHAPGPTLASSRAALVEYALSHPGTSVSLHGASTVNEPAVASVPVNYDDLVEPSWDADWSGEHASPRVARRTKQAFGALATTAAVVAVALFADGRSLHTDRASLFGVAGGPAVRTTPPKSGVATPPAEADRGGAIPTGSPTAEPFRAGLVAGGRHSCALTPAGRAHCWGANDRGQLGDGGVPLSHAVPVPVTGDFSFVALATGSAHTCAVTRLGDVYCWGANARGQLGDATTVRRSAPVRVAGPASYASVAAGTAHSCAVTTDGDVQCWGANDRGQLGTGSPSGGRLIPTPVRVERGVVQVAAGGQHSCAVTTAGRLFCWGANSDGQLGTGQSRGAATAMPQRVEIPGRVLAVSLGSAHSCATTTDGALWCWGRNDAGQLGDGSRAARPTPVRVQVGTGQAVAAVAAGGAHTCALTTVGDVACWGRNMRGAAGAAPGTVRTRPTFVRLPERAGAVAAGSGHTCASSASAVAYCWGDDTDGQLGDASVVPRATPAAVHFPPGVSVRPTSGAIALR